MCYMIAENILSLYFDVYENDPQDIKQINLSSREKVVLL